MRIAVDLLLISLGGALGALSRFGVTELSCWLFGRSFPVGTLLANLVGCFLIGVLMGAGFSDSVPRARLAFGIGFLGSFTTYSTFAVETFVQAEQNQFWLASINLLLHVFCGFIAVGCGLWIGRKLVPTG